MGNWQLMVATYNSIGTGFRDLYWDGTEVVGGVDTASKSGTFNIGYSTVGGRDFDGSIDEVGVWNYALSSAQVANICASAAVGTSPSPAPEPASLALFACGIGGLFALPRFRSRLSTLK